MKSAAVTASDTTSFSARALLENGCGRMTGWKAGTLPVPALLSISDLYRSAVRFCNEDHGERIRELYIDIIEGAWKIVFGEVAQNRDVLETVRHLNTHEALPIVSSGLAAVTGSRKNVWREGFVHCDPVAPGQWRHVEPRTIVLRDRENPVAHLMITPEAKPIRDTQKILARFQESFSHTARP